MKRWVLFLLRGASGVAGQVTLVVLTWVYLCSLQWDNDGLWYQGDAPRHAANGLFWKDYLLSLCPDPESYALSYYARYPVIAPTAYPPVFYCLEGALFAVLGPSPYVAKGLVLLFALVAALYTTAWLRRWVAAEAGWGGALVLLLPGVVWWSHAIMLNVPAFALAVGALYHARRWLESPASRHIYLAATLSVLAVFTYFTACVVAFIIAAWLIALRRWRLLGRPRTLAVGAAGALLMLACLLAVFRWAPPMYLGFLTPSADHVWSVANWAYYPRHLHEIFSPHLIAVAVGGAAAGLVSQRWRCETSLLLIWVAVTYVFFSYLVAKESRYVLLLCTPLVGLVMIAVFALAHGVGVLLKRPPQAVKVCALVALAILLGVQAWLASGVLGIRSLHGFREVAAYFEQVAPAEPVLYNGYHDGIFTFYVQAGDPEFRRQVVLGNKLLYTTPQQGFLEALRTRGGCRWLAIEVSQASKQYWPSPSALLEVAQGPEFSWVRSFPLHGKGVERVEVYRLNIPIESPEEIELPFPILGGGTHYRVRPIRR
jgi:hypothetical protein